MKRFTGQGVFLHAIPAIKAGNRVERKNNNLHKKFTGRNLGVSDSIRNKVISIWNIKQSISINIFKKKIKQFLLSE